MWRRTVINNNISGLDNISVFSLQQVLHVSNQSLQKIEGDGRFTWGGGGTGMPHPTLIVLNAKAALRQVQIFTKK